MHYRTLKKNLTVFLMLSMLLSSCSTGTEPDPSGETERVIVRSDGTAITETSGADTESDFYPAVELSEFDKQIETADAVVITLSGTDAQCDDDDVTIEDGRITVTGGGSYLLTGDYTGQIVVQAGADENVQLILSGADISGTMAPIYISACKNASVTLASGTVNSVTDTSDYTFADGEDEPDAAVFSDCDLTINGEGTLNVTGNYACGIRTKDDLRIVSGNINVTSVGDAVKGRDSVQIAGGNFVISSEADGLKSNNDEDSERGYIVIDGGSFTIAAGDDGVHAESWLVVNAGNLTVTESYEGLEAMKVELNGGNIDVTAADDALNAASPSTGDNEADDWFGQWQDQRQTDKSGKGGNRGGFGGADGMMPTDGVEMPNDMTMPDGMEIPGDMTMPDGMTPPDGMEIPGMPGEMEIPDNMQMPGTPPEDMEIPDDAGSGGFAANDRGGRNDRNNGGFGGFNTGSTGGFGGNMGGKGGMGGGEMAEDGVWIRITGGNIRLCGGVDVLDSNGTIEITGGTVLVDNFRLQIYGSPDGIFDANGSITLSGGTYAAFAQGTGSVTQILQHPYISVSARMTAGDTAEVRDADGNVIFSARTLTGGNVFFLTSDALNSGESYTVTVGDSTTDVTAK